MASQTVLKLAEIESYLEELNAARGADVFNLYYNHADVDTAVHEKRRRDALLEPEVAEVCGEIRSGSYGAPVKRRAAIISDWVTAVRVETDEIIDLKNDIQKIVINTKPNLDGEEIARHEKTNVIFKNEDREKRRRALLESDSKLREALVGKARRLYRLRNTAARDLGFDDFPSLALAGEDLNVAELKRIFDNVERETRAAYEDLLAEGTERFDLGRVESWDLNYVAEQLCSADDKYFPRDRAVPSLAEVVRGVGRDLETMKIPIYEDADIPYAGLCFSIRVPDDIRILVNLKDGLMDLRTLYHEFGHAAHRKFTACDSFPLKSGDAGFFAEAMADMWGMFAERPVWLRAHTDMPEEEISRLTAAGEQAYAVRTRRFMARQSFEIDAYLDADGDLGAALDRHAETFLGFRYGDEGKWAEEYFPLLYPMYSKNYMLARVIQRGIHRYFEREFGELLGEPKVFDFMVARFYADGALQTWREKLAVVGMEL